MLKIKIITVGSLKEKYWVEAIAEYSKRIDRFAKLEIVELPEFLPSSKTSDEIIIKKESEALEKEIEGFVVVLDSHGTNLSSEELASFFADKQVSGISKISFVIGGSLGTSKELKKLANYLLSFGKMTYPHQMMRVILLEQVYRAFTINANVSYHK